MTHDPWFDKFNCRKKEDKCHPCQSRRLPPPYGSPGICVPGIPGVKTGGQKNLFWVHFPKNAKWKGMCKACGGGAVCSVEGCEKPVKKAKLCNRHRSQQESCEVGGCSKGIARANKCVAHGAYGICGVCHVRGIPKPGTQFTCPTCVSEGGDVTLAQMSAVMQEPNPATGGVTVVSWDAALQARCTRPAFVRLRRGGAAPWFFLQDQERPLARRSS
jgi:hypothetical protein